MKLTEAQIGKACDWWAEAVQSPTFDNGDDSETGAMTMMMAVMASQPASRSDADVFKQELARQLREYGPRSLGVDYHPDRLLASAAQVAKLGDMAFPWKTLMRFSDDGSVEVSKGYRAAPIVL